MKTMQKHRSPAPAAEYIRTRKKIGMSNYAFARLLGIHVRTAQRYEAGETPISPTLALLLRYIQAHGVPPPEKRRKSDQAADLQLKT